MNSIRLVKQQNGLKMIIACSDVPNLTNLKEASSIITESFYTNDKTNAILDKVNKFGYTDLNNKVIEFESINTLETTQKQEHKEIISLDITLSISKCNIYLKNELESFLNQLKQTMSLIFGRHIFTSYNLNITINNCIINELVLKTTGNNFKISNSRGYIYLLANIGDIKIENSSLDLYTTDVLLRPTKYNKKSLKDCRVIIPAESLDNAIGKFKGYLNSYNMTVDGFLNINNILFYTNRVNKLQTGELSVEVELNCECCSTLTHIPTCTSIYLESKTYSNKALSGLYVIDDECEYAPTENMEQLYSSVPLSMIKTNNYEVINKILNN